MGVVGQGHIADGAVDMQPLHAVQILQNDASDLTGAADDHHMLSRQAAQGLVRRLDRQGRRGDRRLGQIGLRLNLFGAGDRVAEQGVQILAGSPCLLGLFLGLLDLAEDLILTHYHGIQPRRHGKQVSYRLLILIKPQIIRHVLPASRSRLPQNQLLLEREEILSLPLSCLIISIDLRPVAGGDDDALRRLSFGNQRPHQLLLLLLRKSEQLPDLQRGRLMADADKPDTHDASTPFLNSCVKVLS